MLGKHAFWSALIVGSIVFAPLAGAQDSNTTNSIQNLKKDAQSFQPLFNGAINRSVLRKSSQGTDDVNLVASFVQQVDELPATNANSQLTAILQTATKINQVVYDEMLDYPATAHWQRVRNDLHQLTSADGVPDPVNQDKVASAPPLANDVPCATSLGDRAQILVRDCSQVSAGTNACNARRSCISIVSAIKAGCGSMDSGSQPLLCEHY